MVPAEGCKVLPCGGVSPGQQQEKAGWWCCAGVGVLIGHVGDGMKARPGPLVIVESCAYA